ncbi:hypothetical protein [Sphingobacterium sp. CZ-2]|uniref:hypothetical protein n=1 Tax=Sphingobacterium sp. CZ-2 TaxID=2557994 RepID=UPI00106F5204|nr:hypothetical protein [Sphingobacterium sp. CZ-2]QBR12378.1 hypothetical protein E3D81_09485 [Sphingobacterium sp. CZ-2]
MENPFGIVLLVVAGIIYKIYQSYKEEQAKAKKRLEELKRKHQTVTDYPEFEQKKQPERRPAPVIREERRPAPVIREERRPAPVIREERKPEPASELPDEVKRLQTQNQQRRNENLKGKLKRLEPVQVEELDKNEHFDLRQAVIQQAILNRPYQD